MGKERDIRKHGLRFANLIYPRHNLPLVSPSKVAGNTGGFVFSVQVHLGPLLWMLLCIDAVLFVFLGPILESGGKRRAACSTTRCRQGDTFVVDLMKLYDGSELRKAERM